MRSIIISAAADILQSLAVIYDTIVTLEFVKLLPGLQLEKGSNRCKSLNRDLASNVGPAAEFMHERYSVILAKIYVNMLYRGPWNT